MPYNKCLGLLLLFLLQAPALAAAAAAALVPAAAAWAQGVAWVVQQQQQEVGAARQVCRARACSWVRARVPAVCWRTLPRRRGWPAWMNLAEEQQQQLQDPQAHMSSQVRLCQGFAGCSRVLLVFAYSHKMKQTTACMPSQVILYRVLLAVVEF